MSRREQIVARLEDAVYRNAIIEHYISSMLPFQVRALREQRGWTQQQLGVRCGKKQEWISKLENPQYAKFTLRTLKTLARAFDVALQVKFVSYDNLIGWLNTRHHGDLRVPSYADDAALTKRTKAAVSVNVECVRTAHVSARVLTSNSGPEQIVLVGLGSTASKSVMSEAVVS